MRIEELLEGFDKIEYYRTLEGRLKKMYEAARRRSTRKGWDDMISLSDFLDFGRTDKNLARVYKDWVDSGYQLINTPTLDRKDVNKGYVKGNLDFLSYSENTIKGNKEHGKLPGIHTRVPIIMEKGKTKKEFASNADAASFLSMSPSAFSHAKAKNHQIKGWTLV